MSLIGKTIDGQPPIGGHLIQGKDGAGNAQDILVGTDGRLDLGTVTVTGGGGGVEYVEDAAAAANPTGGATILVREDARAGGITTTDGDNIAQRGNNKGEAYVKDTDAGVSLASIDGKITAVNTGAVVVSSSALPSGAATSARQDTQITAEQAIQTSVQLIDDTVAVLGTDTYTEATTKGLVIGAVRRDADTTLVNTTNEVTPLQTDSRGLLKVEAFSGETLPVSFTGSTDAATQTTLASVLTSVQLTDDTVFTDDTSTHSTGSTKGQGIMAVANPTDAAVDANDIGMVAMTLARAMKNDITTIAGTAPTTAGFIDVKGADGNVFVRQATASNLNMTEASAANILTSVQLIDDGVYTDDTSTHSTGASKGYGMMAVATPTDTAVNANDIGMVGMTNNREQYVSIRDIAGATAVSGSGNATGALRVELANNGTGTLSTVSTVTTVSTLTGTTTLTPGTGATNLGKAEDVAHAGGDVGVMALAVRLDTPVSGANASGSADYVPIITDSFGKVWTAGTYAEDLAHTTADPLVAVGTRRIDTAATSSGSSGDYSTLDASAEGALWSTLTPTTTSGLSVANFTSGDTYTALTNTAQVIKASAGNLYGYYIYNPNATVAYVMVYNIAAASVTVGTSTARLVFAIPATSGANLMFPYPITFSNAGWSCAAATTGGGNTAPGTALEAMFWYK